MRLLGFLLSCAIFCDRLNQSSVSAFVPSHQPSRLRSLDSSLSVSIQNDVRNEDFWLTEDQVRPIIRVGEGEKEKIINLHGLWCVVVTIITCPIWAACMSMVKMVHKMNPEFDVNRALYDKTGKIWSRTWLRMTDSYPSFSGDIDLIRETQGPCLYVANHASWLDIPIICTVLDPVFKFIAKAELEKLPCIGQQLTGGDHILIDRDDRKSQLKTFKDGIGWLKKGVPIMAFPEGKRSLDGRLMDFKGGLFSMAVKTKVPIIPITIGHANSVMPSNALFPVQTGRGKLHVHVHDAIETEGKSDEELVQLVREAFLSTLPFNQHPLNKNGESPGSLPQIQVTSDMPSVRIESAATHARADDHAEHATATIPFFIAEKQDELEVLSK